MKDAYYFPHDSNARNDPKIAALRRKYGWVGYGMFWAIIEVLRDQTNYSYPIGVLYGLSIAIGFDPNDPEVENVDFGKFVDFCLEIKLLQKDGENLYSESLLKRMKPLDVYREAGKKGAEIRWGVNRGLIANTNNPLIAVKESKVKKSKVNKKEIKKLHVFFENERFLKTFKDFEEMRKKMRKPLTPRAIELSVKSLEKYPIETAILMVEQSIQRSWLGIFPLKDIQESEAKKEYAFIRPK